MKHFSSIESLEPRIAPASVIVNDVAKFATWTDHDGDTVTLKWSTKAPTFSTTDQGQGLRVDKINLTLADNSNESFTLTVKPGPVGDGHVDLGRIAAPGVPLKSWVSPAASVYEFDCGDGITGVGILKTGSIGALPLEAFSGTGGSGVSLINGATSVVRIQGDIGATAIQFAGVGKMKSLTVTGSLRGTDDAGALTSGFLAVSGTSVDVLTIGGSVIGGDSPADGELFVGAKVGTLVIKGGIYGGSAASTGFVSATAAKVTIGGSIEGGTAVNSGLLSLGTTETLTIGGSLIGGREGASGNVSLLGVKNVVIKGNVSGGLQTEATVASACGTLSVVGDVKSISIGGDLIAGSYGSGSMLGYNGAVAVGGNLGSITVAGNILGNIGTDALIVAKGSAPATPGHYNAIGSVRVGGTVSYGYIASGHDRDSTSFTARIGAAENPDAGIGSVTVGGDWFHSSLTAGTNDVGSNGFSSNDTHAVGDAVREARIGAVAIRGYILDNPLLSDVSGFAADRIASIIAGGVKLFTTGKPARSLDASGFVDVQEFA